MTAMRVFDYNKQNQPVSLVLNPYKPRTYANSLDPDQMPQNGQGLQCLLT